MHYARKTAATLVLASLCCGAWAKALTFEEIERADTVSGRYISHLSATEMNMVDSPHPPPFHQRHIPRRLTLQAFRQVIHQHPHLQRLPLRGRVHRGELER